MVRKKVGLILILIAAACVSSCFTRLSDPEITMIALRGQTGLLGQSFRIEFRRDGAASIECNFYDLGREQKPKMDAKLICDDLYRQFPGSFRLEGGQLRAKFNGKVSPEDLAELSQSLKTNEFFSMKEGWEFDGRLDAPPSFIEVEVGGGKKEVGYSGSEPNEKFFAIKSAIFQQGSETRWQAE